MADSTTSHREAVDEFVERVDDAEIERLQRIVLFGSVARGTHRSNSDVDVLVVLDDAADVGHVEERLRDIGYDVMLDVGVVFSIHAVTETTLDRRGDHPFFRNVIANGRAIYG